MHSHQDEVKVTFSSSPVFFSDKLKKTPLDQWCIVWDIDSTLALPVLSGGFTENTEGYSYYRFIKEKFPQYIISINTKGFLYDHILFPGAVEAFQYLLTSGSNLALYSSGTDERNRKFNTALLELAFPSDFEKYKDQVKIFSQEKHLVAVDPENKPSIVRADGSPISYGKTRKDLNLVIQEFAKSGIKLSLNNIILIDDDFSILLKGQEKNFLKMPACNSERALHPASEMLAEDYYVNRIFYAIGLLEQVLKSKTPIEDLYKLQFTELSPINATCKWNYNLTKETYYYEAGLASLRKVNGTLQLMREEMLNQANPKRIKFG